MMCNRGFAACFLFLSWGAFAQEAPPSFAPAERVLERLLFPGEFDVVDFDGDGDLDVLAAGNGNDQLGWFEQVAPGQFASLKLFAESAMGDDWNDFEVVDWNGDGRLDVLACEEGGLVFLEQLVDGAFAPAVVLHAGPNPFRMDVADVNGDGWPDVAFADSGSNEVVALMGAGGATVAAEWALAGAAVVLWADWDGDGALDLLMGSYSWGELTVRLGDGEGGFGPEQLLADFGKLSALAAYPTGSGVDLILGVDDTYVLHWHNDGSPPDTLGLFAKAQRFDLADATGDGILDIGVAASTSQECGLIVGAPGGGFLPDPAEFSVPQAMDVALGDLDGDGVAEMVTSSRTRGQVGFRKFDAGGQPLAYVPLIEGMQYVRNAAAGDLNGDGRADVAAMVQGPNVFAGGPEYLHVALSRPEGGFDVAYVPTGTYFGYDVVLVDYDGDGDRDAVVSDYNGDRIVGLRNDGEGSLVLADTLVASINGCDDVVFADLDADGDLDLVAGAWQGSSVVWAFNDGSGHFGPATALAGTGSRCEAVAVADFNADGLEDVAACFENSGDVRVWLRVAGSAPEAMEFGPVAVLPVASAQDLGVGDADADGDVDLFAIGYNEGSVVRYLNDGSGTFSLGSAAGPTDLNGSLGLTVADPDGDGKADWVVSEYGGQRMRFYHAAADEAVELAAGSGPQNAAFGDLDGDGDQDIVLSFYQASEVLWVESLAGMEPAECAVDINGDGEVSTADFNEFLAAYGCTSGCGPADLNGDGGVNVQDLLVLLFGFAEGC